MNPLRGQLQFAEYELARRIRMYARLLELKLLTQEQANQANKEIALMRGIVDMLWKKLEAETQQRQED